MSKYTTEIRFICEMESGQTESKGQANVNTIIQSAIPKIFDFDFPIFDNTYKNVLETKILKHYYTREIAHETYGLWKLKLDTKLNEIMPYYNQLYLSTKKEFDPFNDINLSRSHTTNGSGNNSSEINGENETNNEHKDDITISGNNSNTRVNHSSNSDNETNAYSDTPQGELNNVSQLKYLSTYDVKNNNGTNDINETNTGTSGNTTTSDNTDHNTETNSQNISGNYTSTENYIESLSGKQSSESYSARLLEWRKTFLNIDMQVINDLQELFFNLY